MARKIPADLDQKRARRRRETIAAKARSEVQSSTGVGRPDPAERMGLWSGQRIHEFGRVSMAALCEPGRLADRRLYEALQIWLGACC